jgi:hypothetical protein
LAAGGGGCGPDGCGDEFQREGGTLSNCPPGFGALNNSNAGSGGVRAAAHSARDCFTAVQAEENGFLGFELFQGWRRSYGRCLNPIHTPLFSSIMNGIGVIHDTRDARSFSTAMGETFHVRTFPGGGRDAAGCPRIPTPTDRGQGLPGDRFRSRGLFIRQDEGVAHTERRGTSLPVQFGGAASPNILGGDPGGVFGSSVSGVVRGRTTISRCLFTLPLPLSFSSSGRQQSGQRSNSLPSISFGRHSRACPHTSQRITDTSCAI